jgi:hypothetical protein
LQFGGFCLLVFDVGDTVNKPTGVFALTLPMEIVPFHTNSLVECPINVPSSE